MRINKLIIKNINSLAGEHTIDFDDINERSEGVYLIVGATGSGKTTILDSITLGLFGIVKRFGNKPIGSIDESGAIVTHGAREASVDVQFTINHKKYTSRWQIKHKPRSSGWETAKMSIYDDDLKVMESGLSQAKSKIIELIGMNFDQFNKSIMLAQGDFASFLKSKFSEKADILEKITGTENYTRIGQAVFVKNNELKAVADQIQNKLSNLSIKSKEEVLDLQSKINLIEGQVKLYQARSTELNTIIHNRNTFTKENNSIQSIGKKLELEKAALAEIQLKHGQDIEQFDAAMTIKPVFDNQRLLSQEQNNITETISALKEEGARIQVKLDEIYSNTAEIISISNEENQFLSQLRKFKDDVLVIENDLTSISTNKKHVRINLERELAQTKEASLIQNFQKQDVTTFTQTLLECHKELSKRVNDLKEKLCISIINDDLLENQLQRQRQIESLQHQTQKYREISQQIKLSKENLNEAEKENVRLINALKDNIQLRSVLENTCKDKETILLQQNKIRSMEQHRSQLKADEDCPLCGAADGPLRHHEHLAKDDYQLDYEKAKKAMDENNLLIVRYETQLAGIQKTIENLNTDLASSSNKLDSILEEINIKKQGLNITESLGDPQILILKMEEINSSIISVKSLLKLNEELPHLDEAINYSVEMEALEKTEKETNIQLKAKFPLDIPVQKWSETIESSFETIQNQVRGIAQELSNKETVYARNQQQIETLEIEINKFIVAGKIASIEQLEQVFVLQNSVSLWKKNIENLQQNISINTKLHQASQDRINELNSLIDLTVDIETYTSENQELNTKITTESQELGSIRSQLALHEANVAHGEILRKDLENIEIEWSPVRTLNTLIGSATGHHFKNIAQKITLSHLAVLANKHLALMNDRYKFKFDTKELWSKEEADLMIYDDFEPNGLRSCATLSGGETFIASLALALGLSDFASETSKIESLFIDEGFGTLDPDTLEMAIGALEKIRSVGNKTLCLITHVEAMKERIPYHLVVDKGKKGMSTIRHEMA